MNQPHKHKDMIIAWANGAEIEFRDPASCMKWWSIAFPSWDPSMEYRVKPKEEIYNFRVALMRDTISYFTTTADNEEQEIYMENDPMFIGWLGGWQAFKREVEN